jgi:hypothetical protein
MSRLCENITPLLNERRAGVKFYLRGRAVTHIIYPKISRRRRTLSPHVGMKMRLVISIMFAIILISTGITWGQSGEPATQGTTEEDVRQAYRLISKTLQEGSSAQLRPLLVAKDSEQKPQLELFLQRQEATIAMREARQRLDQMAIAKFGKPLILASAASGLPATRPADTTFIDQAKITIEGDTATVTWILPVAAKGKTVPVHQTLVRQGGIWKLVLNEPPGANAQSLQRFVQMQTNSAEAYSATAKALEAGKYKTWEDAKQGYIDELGKSMMRSQAKIPPVAALKLAWDLTKSHTVQDVGWPKEKTGMFWITDQNAIYQVTLELPGLNKTIMTCKSFEVCRDQHTDSITRLVLPQKEYMTAAQVREFLAVLGVADGLSKQMAHWPTQQPDNAIVSFKQKLAGGGGIWVQLYNARKFTGETDSWALTIQADWQNKDPGFWNEN